MATGLQSTSFDWQNFYVGHLTADITAGATDIFIDTIPTPTESCLVIDPDTPANTEVIFYNSKTATKVTTPANGRGYDGSTAVAHLTGTKVILAPVGDMFRYIRTIATTTPQGWTPLASAPNTVTALGNRSYSCVFNSTDLTGFLSAGMRLRTTRTVAAPTQCTSLNGTTQYYSRASASLGSTMTFTDDFTVSAWVKLNAYNASAGQNIVSRYNGTSGWQLYISTSGQPSIIGRNAAAGNFRNVSAYQSIPLNKWVHIAAQLDMSSGTATTITNYVMIDGVDVPVALTTAGTNPTTLIQAGNLEIGTANATEFFNGKIAQVAIYSAKVTQATILASMHQPLAGTETSQISAYSFNNTINDLNANANNLTANGSAVATNADSPFGGQADGTISSTLDYAIVTKTAFSTNTTVTVQVPEGCTIPTSGGVSAVSYSTQKVPYLFPAQREKWAVEASWRGQYTQGSPVNATWYNPGSEQLVIPIGAWDLGYAQKATSTTTATTSDVYARTTLTSTNLSETDTEYTSEFEGGNTGTVGGTGTKSKGVSMASATTYYINVAQESTGTNLTLYMTSSVNRSVAFIRAFNAYL